MRWAIFAICMVMASSHPARADGAYIGEGLGGTAYHGDFARFGSGAPRLQISGGYVRGPWALEVWGAGLVPDFFYIDCYGDECAAAAAPQLGMSELGIDIRRAWRVVYSTWTNKIGLDFVLHGGPRFAVGTDSLDGYQGVGLGGGAALDLNLKLISMYVDFSSDLVELSGPGGTFSGSLPTIMMGCRLGWM